jgi:hypothetical protein
MRISLINNYNLFNCLIEIHPLVMSGPKEGASPLKEYDVLKIYFFAYYERYLL